jgi:hypothetical protein
MKRFKVKKEVVEYLEYLHPNNRTFELCVMKPKVKRAEIWGDELVSGNGIVAGWFDDPMKVAKLVKQLNEVKPQGIYVSLNRCKKALKGRANNRIKPNVSRTKDNEIYKIANTLIDIDPVRPSGISASEKEHELAIQTAKKISKDLKQQGFPDPLMIDSGNGAQLIIKTHLDNNEENVRLIQQFLSALALKYNNDRVKIDESVFNPGRLVKLPGTYTRKGESLPERPHRRARILKMPKIIKKVSIERLEILASTANKVRKNGETSISRKAALMDVKAYLEQYGVEIVKVKSYRGGKLYVLPKCLFDESHEPDKASIIQSSEGTLYYRCFHNSCRDKRWSDARAKISGEEKLDNFYQDLPRSDAGNEVQYSIMTGAEVLQQRVKEKPIIKGLLEECGSLVMIGQTGIRKSMLTLDIALNLASPPQDKRLWGLFDIPKPINTLFIQSENGIYGTKRRLGLMVKGNKKFGDVSNRIAFLSVRNDCRVTGNLRDKHFQEALKEKIFKTKARLLVVDPLISFHNQNENDNAEIRKVLDQLSYLCDVTKTACLVVHHTGKTSAEGIFAGRGASAIADWAGNILVMTEEELDRIKVHHVKSRNFRTGPPFTLEVSPTLQFTRVAEPIEENVNTVVEVLESLGGEVKDQGKFKKELVKHGAGSESTALRMINDAVEAGKIEEHKDGKKMGYRLKEDEGEQ